MSSISHRDSSGNVDQMLVASKDVTDREQWVEERPGQFQVARAELVDRLRGLMSD